MKKSIILLITILIVFFTSSMLKAQNTTITDNATHNADTTAVLDIFSESKGLLVPRLTNEQRTSINDPANGLLVYDTDQNTFYYYKLNQWQPVAGMELWKNNGDSVYISGDGLKVGIGTTEPVGRFSIQGDSTAASTEPLFEVKNSDGLTIFAVYEDHVDVNFIETGKGVKGGFAVGGLTPGKSSATEYLRITPDSVRIYINDTLSKGVKGGFAVGGLTPGKTIAQEYLKVTPDSSRVYVKKTAKGVKGGFAVGGLTPGKATGDELLHVSEDSVRVYIDNTGTKGVKGGFAVGGLTPGKSGEEDYFNITADTTAEVVNNESRIMWYPKKSAFLAGEVHVGSADSVGKNSTALGYHSISKGEYSQAFGFQSMALGDYSTAIGKNAIADSANSFAFGNEANASALNSYAFGSGAIASGENSYAFGSVGIDSSGTILGNTIATGQNSLAMGFGSRATGTGSVAIGTGDSATYNYSTAIGYQSKAKYHWATAIGKWAEATNDGAVAIGYRNQATGHLSTALGTLSRSAGTEAVAIGRACYAGAWKSVAIGNNAETNNTFGIAIGYFAQAGYSAFSFGHTTVANGDFSSAFGRRITVNGENSIGFGLNNTTYTIDDPNIMSIMGGKVGIGIVSPDVKVHIEGGTDLQLASGGFLVLGAKTSTNVVFDDNEIQARNNGSASTLYLNNEGGDVRINDVVQNGDKSLFTTSKAMNYGLKDIVKLQPYLGVSKKSVDKRFSPVLFAEDVEQIFPEIVKTSKVAGKGIDYNALTVIMVNSIKELNEKTQEYERKINELDRKTSEIDELKSQLSELKNIIKNNQ